MTEHGNSMWRAYAWKMKRRWLQARDVTFQRDAYPASAVEKQIQDDAMRFRRELEDFDELRQRVESYARFWKQDYDTLVLGAKPWFQLLYHLVRLSKPNVVIETGCATG